MDGASLHGLSHAEAVNVLRGCDGMTVFKIARLPANADNNEVSLRPALRNDLLTPAVL